MNISQQRRDFLKTTSMLMALGAITSPLFAESKIQKALAHTNYS